MLAALRVCTLEFFSIFQKGSMALFNKRSTLQVIALVLIVIGANTFAESKKGYQIPNTEVHIIPSKPAKRPYQVWVDFPESYAKSNKKFPVVFVTDPQYAFTLAHGVRHLLGRRGQNIEDFILVGLSMPQGEDIAAGRSRDYTPTNPLPKDKSKRDPKTYAADQYGQAETYRNYIESEVLPFIAKNYRADMQRKVLIGHSYGSLFAAYTLLTKPSLFETYILGSPSFWFDRHVIFKIEEQYAKNHQDLKARVMMFAGSYETTGSGERYYKDTDLTGDVLKFEKQLKARKYPGLEIGAKILADEDHFTVFSNLLGRGLLWALPGFGPYTSG